MVESVKKTHQLNKHKSISRYEKTNFSWIIFLVGGPKFPGV